MEKGKERAGSGLEKDAPVTSRSNEALVSDRRCRHYHWL